MPKLYHFTLPFDADLDTHVRQKLAEIRDYRVTGKSLDARGAPRGRKPQYHYTIEALVGTQDSYPGERHFPRLAPLRKPPIIIGAGPAGLFCAVMLAEHGVPSILLERGESADRRMLKIAQFWRYGKLDPETNVCYGEGGAGLYSDGKLITRVKSSHIGYVMERLVSFGAPPEVAYASNPHLGSNKIRQIITNVAGWLRSQGCEMRSLARVDRLLYEGSKVIGVELNDGSKLYSDHVVLATGHSAHDMYTHLMDHGVGLRLKDFAVGVRIEHSRRHIDQIQHGPWAEASELGAARYRLSWHDQSCDVGVYSFCMCPGGYVLSSGTESDGLVVNGMSNFARNSPWSNSAIVVSVKSSQFSQQDLLAGIRYQRNIETEAFKMSQRLASGREIPAVTVGEFIRGKLDVTKPLPATSCPSHIFKAPLEEIMPEAIIKQLQQGLQQFAKTLPGFVTEKALLMAPETRTSSPLTIVRDVQSLMSVTHHGLYPCGEGAGYAGGITSAAVDGVKVALALLAQEKLLPPSAP